MSTTNIQKAYEKEEILEKENPKRLQERTSRTKIPSSKSTSVQITYQYHEQGFKYDKLNNSMINLRH